MVFKGRNRFLLEKISKIFVLTILLPKLVRRISLFTLTLKWPLYDLGVILYLCHKGYIYIYVNI